MEDDRDFLSLTALRPLSAKAYDYAAGHLIEAHAHAAGQIVYAISGAMSVMADNAAWVVPPLRAVWIAPHVHHAVQMLSDVSMRTVYLREDAASILDAPCCVLSVSGLLRELIVEATCFTEEEPPTGRNKLVIQLLLAELERSPQIGLHLAEPQDKRLRLITEALRSSPGDSRQLSHWAKLANASERTLARLFLKETGLTFAQWRQQARLLAAVAMLAQGLPVTTIAIDLGYSTPSAFGHMFRRALGSPPSEYFGA